MRKSRELAETHVGRIRIVSYLAIHLLILLPLLVLAQPTDPGDPDIQINGTSVQVARNPQTVIDGGSGQISDAWANPDHARTQDDAYAFLVTTTKNKTTHFLQAQNFGFTIPAGSSIDGILVEVDRYADVVGGDVSDSRISIVNAAGHQGIINQSTGVVWPIIDTDTYQSYGGPTDTWGITDWTSSQINNVNFGVAISAQTSNDKTTFNLFVDEIRITIYYTTSGAERYAVASGSWNNPNSWSTASGGTPGASIPSASNDVYIGGGFSILQNVNGASCNSLTIGTGETNPVGSLTFDSNGRNMSIGNGGLQITTDGDILGAFTPTLTVAGDVTLDAVLTNRNFLLTINGTNSDILSGAGSLGKLSIQSFTTHTGTITITGSVTGPAVHFINGSSGHLTYSGTSSNMDNDVMSLITDGNIIEFPQTLIDAPNFDITRASNIFYSLIISGNSPKFYNRDIVVNGDLTISSTGILNNQNQHQITLGGNWTNNNGTDGFVSNSCTSCSVVFNGTTDQIITNAAGAQFYQVEVANGVNAVVVAANDISITNQLLMSSGNLDVGAHSLSGTGSLALNGGTLIIGTIGTTVPELLGGYTLVSGDIVFNGAGPQTIRSTTSIPAIDHYKIIDFAGSGTKSLSGPIVVETDLRISGSALLDVTASNFAINIEGDWTNTSTFDPRNGTVTFGGAASLFITNPAGANYYNLTINNSTFSSSVILNDPVRVSGQMTFILGDVISSDTSMLTLGADASVVGASDASHVVGPVGKIVDSTTPFPFPVGNGVNYMPATIVPTSSVATNFIGRYFSLEQSVGTTESGIDHVSAQDYWTIQRTSGTADATVTLVWEYQSAADAEIDNLADLLVAQWDGSNWVSRGNAGTTGNFVAGSVQSNTITDFTQSQFVIGSSSTNNPLSNWRYFAPLTGNWNDPGVWAYRAGGPTNAPEPTSTKFVVIQSGNTATILDTPTAQATKTMESLTVLGTLVLSNAASQDVIVNVGKHGFTLGNGGNIVGSDNGDRIQMSGSISLNNTSSISHTLLETNFLTQGNTITGSGGLLPILNINQSNQTFTGSTSFASLKMGSAATNNGTITITGSISGNGPLTNSALGTIVWQGTSVPSTSIDATTPGNTVQLTNTTGGTLTISSFVKINSYHNLILGGTDPFDVGADVAINGDLNILPGAVFNSTNNKNDLIVFGNWINNGTFNATTGTVFFNGTTTISGSSPSNFNSIEISGTLTTPSVFNVAGDFTNNGSLVSTAGTVVFNGSSKQSISGLLATTFNNITDTNSSGTVQVQSDQFMTGVLTLSPNAVFDADGSANNTTFTLLSTGDDPTSDASVAQLPSSALVTGNVTVQRYMAVEGINGGRIYRYISSPVQNAPVSQIQEFIPVSGTFSGASSCSGCTANPSMFLYDETVITDINGSGVSDFNDGYIGFPSVSNSETFSPGRGYTIFVRANVAPIVGFDSVVWSLRGPINSGPVTLPVSFTSSGKVANDGWNLVGNPYPSTIDWDAAGWTRSNLDNTTYILDNGLASPVYATHVAGGASTNRGTQYIAMGQGFYVKSNGGTPSLQADETVKVAATQTTFFRTASIPDMMRIILRQGDKADETIVQFKSEATAGFDLKSDATKLDNPLPMYSLATISSGERYVINALPLPTSKTEVPLDIASVTAGTYSLEFKEFESFANPSMALLLRDDFLNTLTDIRANPKYSFDITSDSRSLGSARFTIVFDVTLVTGLSPEGPPFAVYPNPTNNTVNVEVTSDNDVSAKIISVTGTTLYQKDLQGGAIKKGSFNLQDQADGIYILMIQDGGRLVMEKILKK